MFSASRVFLVRQLHLLGEIAYWRLDPLLLLMGTGPHYFHGGRRSWGLTWGTEVRKTPLNAAKMDNAVTAVGGLFARLTTNFLLLVAPGLVLPS